MQSYEVELKSKYAILFHQDDVEAADELDAWRKDPANKKISKAGDDRSPAWTWQTYLYTDGEHVTIPMENIMSCLRKAGAKIKLQGQETMKSLTQSGLLITDPFWEFFGPNGKKISMASINALQNLPFSHQAQEVKKLGFELLVKRAQVGSSKHVRVRAMFKSWTIRGTIHVTEDEEILNRDVVQQIFDLAGKYVGLLDWRPSSKISPGPYGTFLATVKPAA